MSAGGSRRTFSRRRASPARFRVDSADGRRAADSRADMATTEATNTTVEVPRATRGPAILAVVAVVAGVAAYAAFGPPGRGGRPDLFGTRGTAPPRAIKYVEAYRGTPYAEATLVQVAADGRHALVGGLADCVVVELSRGKEVGCLDVRLSMSDVAATSSGRSLLGRRRPLAALRLARTPRAIPSSSIASAARRSRAMRPRRSTRSTPRPSRKARWSPCVGARRRVRNCGSGSATEPTRRPSTSSLKVRRPRMRSRASFDGTGFSATSCVPRRRPNRPRASVRDMSGLPSLSSTTRSRRAACGASRRARSTKRTSVRERRCRDGAGLWTPSANQSLGSSDRASP
jgi:hypothetical protein